MLLTDEDSQEMEHEPMRTESTGDITLGQPIAGHAADVTANGQPYQQAYINNNTGTEHAPPVLSPHWWYHYAAAALNPHVFSPSVWGSMGNGTSVASSSNMNLSIDGSDYNIAQAKTLFMNMRDDLTSTQVGVGLWSLGELHHFLFHTT